MRDADSPAPERLGPIEPEIRAALLRLIELLAEQVAADVSRREEATADRSDGKGLRPLP
jgi:hypothetical protein